ncbi:Putative flippase GtrA (transmembrane translocase of bactoprenol-linked glucose) [Ruminococcus sp. YE71]|uniref:GtrA family protein n=1 Tax=unclassified Ruminococcus TaxID=2608920 RepID=UPI0008823B1A|nr:MULTISPECIES: GtrA family protein [unclassified Ruminococcus]SDA10168.1 Putative flippase GtrA (transmembrane translocase of bactoprenol-linked glucose) [Ruminococcus sp. YE78]SFW11043.1 Putative flippase GtrA (transmembrane translocase of bactoprenol-linked glucose) [Ruminococcus sp. YE71]
MKNKIRLKELLRFLVGGGSAVLVDFLSYHLLMYLGLSADISKAVSYVLGAAVGFVINKLWTFESKHFHSLEIVKYILLYAVSAFINTMINHLVLWLTDISILAFLAATGTSTVINFIGQKFFVFTKKGDTE